MNIDEIKAQIDAEIELIKERQDRNKEMMAFNVTLHFATAALPQAIAIANAEHNKFDDDTVAEAAAALAWEVADEMYTYWEVRRP